MRPEPSFARSLVAWGNACLSGRLPLDAFDLHGGLRPYLRAVSFRDGAHELVCSSAWLQWLLGALSDIRLMLDVSGVTGNERVVVVAGNQAHSSWQQRWDRIAGAKEAPWFDAIFVRQSSAATIPPEGRCVSEVLALLTTALEGLVALSRRADLDQWGEYFAHALAVARGETAAASPSPLPPTVSAQAHTLATAANLGDVFGGMGSWNDFAPLADGQAEEERKRYSIALFDAVEAALLATAHGR